MFLRACAHNFSLLRHLLTHTELEIFFYPRVLSDDMQLCDFQKQQQLQLLCALMLSNNCMYEDGDSLAYMSVTLFAYKIKEKSTGHAHLLSTIS